MPRNLDLPHADNHAAPMPAIRPATLADLDPLAQLWLDGWTEAHAAHVPPELTAKRPLDSFRRRLDGFDDRLRTAGPVGAPLGLCVVTNDELDQIFVSAAARGTGLATSLLADGEARMAASGVTRAHLLCVIENTRAVRFYERHGWQNAGPSVEAVFTDDGPFKFNVLRFEKTLKPA